MTHFSTKKTAKAVFLHALRSPEGAKKWWSTSGARDNHSLVSKRNLFCDC
jgi:hypothetical protein